MRTPPSESQPARRQRKKNEHNARQRAICRLDADGEHARYKEAERARKRSSRPALAWEKPTFWQLPCEARTHIEERSSWLLHEHVQLSPRGSRAHSFDHTSPGGTVWVEEYKSPADGRATREQRCGWRSRIVHARREALVPCAGACYNTKCKHCMADVLIGRDGRMHAHKVVRMLNHPVTGRVERAAYRESDEYGKNGWECPGSRRYYGPNRQGRIGEDDDDAPCCMDFDGTWHACATCACDGCESDDSESDDSHSEGE